MVICVNERGQKHFLAIEDGVRESIQNWREVLLNLKSRGMSCPKLAIGDGAMGFWSALEEVYLASQPIAALLKKAAEKACFQIRSVCTKALATIAWV